VASSFLLIVDNHLGSQPKKGDPGRNKFQPVTDCAFAPIPIHTWSTALATVDQDPARVQVQYLSPDDQKYIFPEPGIFIATNETRRNTYFTTWQAIEPACIYRLLSSSSSTAHPLSNQEWRDILIGDIPSRKSDSFSARSRSRAQNLLGPAINDLGIEINDVSRTTAPTSFSNTEAQWMLWRLTELNFRFELLSLDRRIGLAGRSNVECQDALRDCLQVGSLLMIDPEHVRTGLYSEDWHSRLPSLLRLRTLMRGWPGVIPPALLDERSVEDYTESDVFLLEDAVACFYTDMFFCYFGRAAIIPARLP
jgi:hypothetical protein